MPTMARERLNRKQQKTATATGKMPRRKGKCTEMDRILDGPTLEEKLNGKFGGGRQKAPVASDNSDEESSLSEESDKEESEPTKTQGKTITLDEDSSDGEQSAYEEQPKTTLKPRKSTVTPRNSTAKPRNSTGLGKPRGKNDTRETDSITASPSSDIQSEKEKRRVQDADNRKADSNSNKIIKDYKAKVDNLQKSTEKKGQKIDTLQDELDALKRKHGLLENDHARALTALQHIRNNPQQFVIEVAKKGPRKTTKKQKTRELNENEGASVTSAMLNQGKDTVKTVYRTIKFINNNKQEAKFFELMLDNLGKEELIVTHKDTDEQKAEIEKKRQETINDYGQYWISELNVHRTYVQAQCKKNVFEWMAENNIETLPATEIFTDCIAIRDFSRFDIKDTDTDERKEEKRAGLLGAQQIMDMYTEKLIPAVAGPKLFHANIRHFEEMTTSLLPTGVGQLRIPASTEAMAILAYDNNRIKWEAMRKWKKNHPGSKLPQYKASFPDVNVEFREKYSCSAVGQSPWGGWSDEGRKYFNRLQKKILDSRTKNEERHVKHDKECVARLYEKYKEMHRDTERPTKKQRVDPDINPDDDEELDYVFEA